MEGVSGWIFTWKMEGLFIIAKCRPAPTGTCQSVPVITRDRLISTISLKVRTTKTFVIFVCTFDPFGKGGCIYTFENSCKEYPGLGLGDETEKIFLNTKGTKENVSRNLKELLEYMDTSELPDDCSNPLIPELDAALNEARKNEEWRREFMTLEMLKQDYMKEGRAEGRADERKEMIYYMLLDQMDVDRIARIARVSTEEVLRIKNEHKL